MIVSMALQAIYNIVDSYFVSSMKDTVNITNMGDYGVNALTLAFPIQMLMIAIGVGTGVGFNALLSKSLGEGKKEKASKIAGNSIFLGFCTYIVFLLFGIFGVNAYLHTQTQDPIVIKMAGSYLRICTILSFGVTMYITYEKLLQATGRTILSTVAQLAGISAILMQALMSFMTYGVNIIFGAVSASAVTAYGVYYKIQQFLFFAAFGMNNAMIPIIGFNYGMKDKKRVNDGIKYGMIYTLIIMAIGLIGLQVFAHQVAAFVVGVLLMKNISNKEIVPL